MVLNYIVDVDESKSASSLFRYCIIWFLFFWSSYKRITEASTFWNYFFFKWMMDNGEMDSNGIIHAFSFLSNCIQRRIYSIRCLLDTQLMSIQLMHRSIHFFRAQFVLHFVLCYFSLCWRYDLPLFDWPTHHW